MKNLLLLSLMAFQFICKTLALGCFPIVDSLADSNARLVYDLYITGSIRNQTVARSSSLSFVAYLLLAAVDDVAINVKCILIKK